MAKDRFESKYVTVAPGVELHILEKGEVSDTTENSICAFRILRFGTRVFQILIGHISVPYCVSKMKMPVFGT